MTPNDTPVTEVASGTDRDAIALVYGLLACVGAGASALFLSLGLLGVPLTLILGVAAIWRGIRRKQRTPIVAAVVAFALMVMWFVLIAIEASTFFESICCTVLDKVYE